MDAFPFSASVEIPAFQRSTYRGWLDGATRIASAAAIFEDGDDRITCGRQKAGPLYTPPGARRPRRGAPCLANLVHMWADD
jgi:hypothetical protein